VRLPRNLAALAAMAVPATLALCPVPALASDEADEQLGEVAAELSDPERQAQASAMAGAMIAAMLDMPVGELLRSAAEIAGEDPEDVDPDTTVADMAGDDAAAMPGRVAERVPEMMGAMAGMSDALAAMLPRFREMAETMRRTLPEGR